METTHNCVQAIRKGLLSAEGISNVEIHLANIQDVTKQDTIVKTGQKLSYVQQITLKNGEKRNKKVNTFLTHVYCPFCGKEYKEEKVNNGLETSEIVIDKYLDLDIQSRKKDYDFIKNLNINS